LGNYRTQKRTTKTERMKATFDTVQAWETQLVSTLLKEEATLLTVFLKPTDVCESLRKEWEEDLKAIKHVYHYYSGKRIK
jgi:hypothetical protein